MQPYFTKTKIDEEFYLENLEYRMPERIFDIHIHINLEEHVKGVSRETILSDWALECGITLPCEDAYYCAAELFPGVKYRIAGMPWPIQGADIKANNKYLAEKKAEGRLFPFMSTLPEWETEYVEEILVKGGFVGFKPYPDIVSGKKGADISLFDFITADQLKILDRHRKAVIFHLPRQERLADPDNIRELLDIRQKYPDITIIIAHFGRSFCPYYLSKGLDMMGGAEGFYFDTAAVINPEVYHIAFQRIPADKILYGSDLPIFFWHGKRKWTERQYINLCRENFSWNRHHEPSEEEYTLFLYEQLKAVLDAIDKAGFQDDQKRGIFWENSLQALKLTSDVFNDLG